jgi:hypothetical protein
LCSNDCQKADWRNGHKIWCKRVGELEVDFEIKESNERKGNGIFAKRTFSRGDYIMVERPLFLFPGKIMVIHGNKLPFNIPDSAKQEMELLLPREGSLLQKLNINGMSCGGDEAGLFITLSRINHNCDPNADHQFWKSGLKILYATKNIEKGEEITISYCKTESRSLEERKEHLLLNYGFECDCRVCRDTKLNKKFESISLQDKAMWEAMNAQNFDKALVIGKKLIKLFDELECSQKMYARTYYDMFQVAILKKSTLQEGIDFIRKAYEYDQFSAGGSDEEYKIFMDNPRLHPNYLNMY